MTRNTFRWEAQTSYSWRGRMNNEPYWVILTVDHQKYTLQVPGCYSGSNGIRNISFNSFDEAVCKADQIANEC